MRRTRLHKRRTSRALNVITEKNDILPKVFGHVLSDIGLLELSYSQMCSQQFSTFYPDYQSNYLENIKPL
jgi:hypothetical protein